METYFLILLLVLMMGALISGFPVAFALPGSAILSIGIASLAGYISVGDISAFFVQGGPVEWLTAGVTNLRSLYWDVERDTLIAVPLFIFMGIMLQRSKIAEDLLVAMAQLFGPVPGGLGISVVFVGALLAATTGIVGATVIAMGLISLPAMLRNNYSKSLSSGIICASGTLGQIIPPSIVLILLADQLSNASDIASTARAAQYKEATGEFILPSALDVTSTSAGDMFMGAFFPGLVLVGLYMLYILIYALIKPDVAPAVPTEGKYDFKFFVRISLALVPPLFLIFAVLGSIILGIATVNQAGSIGAIGAIIMGGYRLYPNHKNTYLPAILAIGATISIGVIMNFFDLNVRNIKTTSDVIGVTLATISVAVLIGSSLWSAWRIYKIDDTLRGVMTETAKTTSMVFVILLGAAMLTTAFRGFGGEELVKDFLTSLDGGFWAQFIVVMAVIFFLGFFLDFIEIAVVVVPIVAPILLAEPSANITAVWLGVMIGMNMQTSFLTPPFGFSLFYLRSVAPPSVRTQHIYKGVVAFIMLQLAGLTIAGYYPALVNYLPKLIYLTSEAAPPPVNPKLQVCLEEYLFEIYDNEEIAIRNSVKRAASLDTSYLPTKYQDSLSQTHEKALNSFALIKSIREAEKELSLFVPEYRPIHEDVRRLEKKMKSITKDIKSIDRRIDIIYLNDKLTASDSIKISELSSDILEMQNNKNEIASRIPSDWKQYRDKYLKLSKAESKARRSYRRNVDEAYEALLDLQYIILSKDRLAALEGDIISLERAISTDTNEQAMIKIKLVEKQLGNIPGASKIKSKISKSRRAIKRNPDIEKAIKMLNQGLELFYTEVSWRNSASSELIIALKEYDSALRNTVGVRMQERLNDDQAEYVAGCLSNHKDISLSF
jgi:tripartite ATP-independent transporter DctM subunit